MLPTIRQMQYFSAVAEQKSFSKAASACHVTQSTLSAAIRQFEEILGAELIDRSGRRPALSAAGRAVLSQVHVILGDTAELSSFAQQDRPPLSGKIRLGVIPSIAPFLLPQVLPKLRKLHPDLRLYLREELTRNLLDDLKEGRLDLVLMAFPYQAEGVEAEIIAQDRLLVVMPESHPLARRARILPEDLRGEQLLLLEDGHCLREHVLGALGGAPKEEEEIQASSMTTLISMVGNNLGVSLIPQIAADAGIIRGADLKLAPFASDKAVRELGLVWRRRSCHQGDGRALARYLRLHMGGAPAAGSAEASCGEQSG